MYCTKVLCGFPVNIFTRIVWLYMSLKEICRFSEKQQRINVAGTRVSQSLVLANELAAEYDVIREINADA